MTDHQQLGKYKIEAHIGSGAYADVYRAMDETLKRTVALKVLKPMLLADEEAFARFVQEAQTAAGLFHPHIATVLDLGEAEGHYFLAMRYVDGLSLDKLLAERCPLPWDEALRIIEQISEALQFAHDKGLIHRDIKPQNILFSESEGAVLTDFGLVKAIASSGLTTTGTFLGTPNYMAPEIWKDEEITSAVDQYALACVLVEMLTGRVLFDGSTPPAVMAKHFQPAKIPEILFHNIPSEITNILKRALNQESRKRYKSLKQFASYLQSSRGIPSVWKRKPDQRKMIIQELRDSMPEWMRGLSPSEQEEQTLRLLKQHKRWGIDKQSDSSTNSTNSEFTMGYAKIIDLAPEVELTLVGVPAGSFLMGSCDDDQKALDQEKPQHSVHLDEYWIGKFPVTNAQYKVFVETTNYPIPFHWYGGGLPKGKENHPVVEVSWQDASAFCAWISLLTVATLRLPTEAEWEKAARGTDARKYPWGNQKPDPELCNFHDNIGGTTQVGRYSPAGDSSYGCSDMAGNVFEWTSSVYKDYPYRIDDGREIPDAGDELRVASRGGAFGFSAGRMRCALRFGYFPKVGCDYIGFRVCTSLPTESKR